MSRYWFEEGDECKTCCVGKLVEKHSGEGCSCHISPPCSYCTDTKLVCDECGEAAPEETYRAVGGNLSERLSTKRPMADLGDGKKLFDYDYDSRSGSTMVYSGKYEGPVTAADIFKYFGDGTFGHRGPSLHDGRFHYTKITD